MKFLAVITVRNEGAFLLEWLAHHRAVGITDFLVFSNDCQDGTDVMLDRLQEQGVLTHVRNDGPYDTAGIQFTALKTADKLDIVTQADWIISMDVDEFINIHTGDGTLPALLCALPDATAITLTWRLFGNHGVVQFDDAPITSQFTHCAPIEMQWPWRAAMFKTLYRNDGIYCKLGVHRPRSPDKSRLDEACWFDGEGRILDASFKNQRIFSNYGQSNYALVQMNHYPLGAMESYILKADRGRVNRSALPLGADYWVERNFSTDQDRTILRMAPKTQEQRAKLVEDRQLEKLHVKSVAWRKARFDHLMQNEASRALFGRLMMTPASQPLDPNAAEFLLRYARRARKNATK